jgi:DNA-binding transcriptional regulator YhcF (GntR family)
LITLDRRSSAPLIRQVYSAIRDAILSGKLRAGSQVPSTRTLARELGVSRTTVVVAYDHLIAEGYIEPVSGAGSFVSSALREAGERAQANQPRVQTAPQIGRAAYAYLNRTAALHAPERCRFALANRPCSSLQSLVAPAESGMEERSTGCPALRRSLRRVAFAAGDRVYLAATRGVKRAPSRSSSCAAPNRT